MLCLSATFLADVGELFGQRYIVQKRTFENEGLGDDFDAGWEPGRTMGAREVSMHTIVRRLVALAVVLVVGCIAFPQVGHAGSDCCECAQKPACDQNACCECKEGKEPGCPPKLHNLRFMENWAPCLCKDCCELDHWSHNLKARMLTRRPKIWYGFGAQARVRYESFQGMGFGAPADPDDDWLLARLRAHADVHAGDHLRFFVEGIYADQWTRDLGPRPIDVNEGDLLNAFAEITTADRNWGVWGGRREIQYGAQRLLSPLDWANTRRTFEGFGGWANSAGHRLDAFAVAPVIVDATEFDEANDNVDLYGLYYTNTSMNCLTWDLYGLLLERDNANAFGMTADESRWTVGARALYAMPQTRLDLEVEGAYQFGEFGTQDISAHFVAAELAWRPCMCWEPRLALAFDLSSGDSDPADNELGTFNQLFPLGHAYHGFADVLGRQNLTAVRARLQVKPAEKLKLGLDYHMFWRTETRDAAYAVTGGVLRPAGGSSESELGSEIDFTATYALDARTKISAGYSHFMTGQFFTDTGADDNIDFWWASFQLTL